MGSQSHRAIFLSTPGNSWKSCGQGLRSWLPTTRGGKIDRMTWFWQLMTARNNVISALETFLVAPSYSSDRYPVLLSCPIGYSLCQPLSISSPPRWSFIKKLRYSVVAPATRWRKLHGKPSMGSQNSYGVYRSRTCRDSTVHMWCTMKSNISCHPQYAELP